jgi:hypothetical protein
MSKVAIGIITYPRYPARLEYLEDNLKSIARYLAIARHDVAQYCSCEFDRSGDVGGVARLCKTYGWSLYLKKGTPCMGANTNNSMRIAFDELGADYLLHLIDDSLVINAVDLSDAIDFLDATPEVDILRCHWSGRPGALPTFHERADGYMQVDPESYRFYDDSPHLRRSTFVDKFGWSVEATPERAGYIEREMTRTLRARGANIVAMPRLWFAKGGAVSACH